SLLELLVAVVIVGILSAIALPNFLGQTNKARTTEATAVLSAIASGQEELRFRNSGSYIQIGVDGSTVPTATAGSNAYIALKGTAGATNTRTGTPNQVINFAQLLGIDIGPSTAGDRWYFSTIPRSDGNGTVAAGAADGAIVSATDFTANAYGIDAQTIDLGAILVYGRGRTYLDVVRP
ncbi:MAG: hypothetical protein H7Y22_09585, partial [Gemmatimonadaceae bacterium]|nr:hypothetical protein [Gloeobacterales cyanobacterium ES-bin-141]